MPVIAAVATAAFSAIGSTIAAVASWTIGIGGVKFGIGRALLSVGLNLGLSKLLAPKAPSAAVAQRQASVLTITLGEHPREAIFGRACTGGSLLDAFNYGPDFEWEVLVIAIADHECDALEGFYVDDRYVEFDANGFVSEFSEGDEHYLFVEWHSGTATQQASATLQDWSLQSGEPDQWGPNDTLSGVAYVSLCYRVSDKFFSARPGFKWVVRGHKNYDPRKDSTVPGGSGSHRWNDLATREWDENAAICRYNFIRGVWSNGQLMVGPGKSAEEAPPENEIARANVCDLDVALKVGGTEKYYTCGAVVRADEEWIEVEENFAAAMGGELIELAGQITAEPGIAKLASFAFFDSDIIVGDEVRYQAKVTRDQLVNTVVATYIDPTQLWEPTSAPLRRSVDDIATDGEARELPLALHYVTSGTQAQRIAEIFRRKARLQAQAVVTLGPKYMRAEVGDWCEWNSARYTGGTTRLWEVVGVSHDERGCVRLAIRRIETSVYSWTAATDEIDADNPVYLPPGAMPPASVADFDAQPIEITAANGSQSQGMRATWTPTQDRTVTAYRLEYRPTGAVASSQVSVDPRDGVKIIDVLPIADVDYEIRAIPVAPGREVVATAWRQVTLSVPLTLPDPPAQFTGYQNGDLIRFSWTPHPDSLRRYEIRAGETFDTGRVVDNVAGSSSMVQWPIVGEDDEVIFWIKSIDRVGRYSVGATLWVATLADIGDRNFIISEDYQADEFPGVRHDMSDDTAGGEPVLALDQVDGVSLTRGDYFTSASLLREFYARSWITQRASSFINDVPEWGDTEATWDDLGEADWEPDIGDPGAAKLETFIALDADLPASLIDGFRFNGSTTGANGLTPYLAEGVSYADAKTAQGVTLSAAGALWYAVDFEQTLSLLCDVRVTATPEDDVALATLSNSSGDWLQLWRRASDGKFVLEGDSDADIEIACPCIAGDTISFAIWQSATGRGLVMATRSAGLAGSGDITIGSAPLYTDLSVGGSTVEGADWDDSEETWDDNDETWSQFSIVGPGSPPFPGVFGDLAIYAGATQGAAFSARWELRGPIGFSDFQPFLPGDYEFQNAAIWMRLTSPQPFTQILSITRAKLNVDVPDVIDRGEATLPAEGAWITFERAFYEPPAVTATQRSGATRGVVVVEDVEPTRFFARMYQSNSPGTGLAGDISFAANGY